MVTHRGTAQNDDTVPVAAEPAGGPRSETTLVSYATVLAPTGSVPGCTQHRPITDSAKRSAAQRDQVQRRAKRVRCNALLGGRIGTQAGWIETLMAYRLVGEEDYARLAASVTARSCAAATGSESRKL